MLILFFNEEDIEHGFDIPQRIPFDDAARNGVAADSDDSDNDSGADSSDSGVGIEDDAAPVDEVPEVPGNADVRDAVEEIANNAEAAPVDVSEQVFAAVSVDDPEGVSSGAVSGVSGVAVPGVSGAVTNDIDVPVMIILRPGVTYQIMVPRNSQMSAV